MTVADSSWINVCNVCKEQGGSDNTQDTKHMTELHHYLTFPQDLSAQITSVTKCQLGLPVESIKNLSGHKAFSREPINYCMRTFYSNTVHLITATIRSDEEPVTTTDRNTGLTAKVSVLQSVNKTSCKATNADGVLFGMASYSWNCRSWSL